MITCQKASLVLFKMVPKGNFGPDSKKDIRPKLPFWIIWIMFWGFFEKKHFWANILLRIWTKFAFWKWTSTVLQGTWAKKFKRNKVDHTCLWSKSYTWFWTLSTIFLDQNMRLFGRSQKTIQFLVFSATVFRRPSTVVHLQFERTLENQSKRTKLLQNISNTWNQFYNCSTRYYRLKKLIIWH